MKKGRMTSDRVPLGRRCPAAAAGKGGPWTWHTTHTPSCHKQANTLIRA